MNKYFFHSKITYVLWKRDLLFEASEEAPHLLHTVSRQMYLHIMDTICLSGGLCSRLCLNLLYHFFFYFWGLRPVAFHYYKFTKT
jgi:hypothetical protein